VGGRDKLVKIWEVATGAEVRTPCFLSRPSIGRSLFPSSDGKRVVSGSGDNLVELQDGRGGVQLCGSALRVVQRQGWRCVGFAHAS